MRKEYDLTAATPNPYIKRLKKAVTIRLEPDVIGYFKELSLETHIPYQNLINLYLLDCAREQRRISLKWDPSGVSQGNGRGQGAGFNCISDAIED